MSRTDRFRRKLAALFHDPIDKPFVLMQRGARHEERARELAERLGLSLPPFESSADHIASAMERGFVSADAPSVRFLDNPEIRHPLSGRPLVDVDPLRQLDPATVEEVVNQAFDALDLPAEADDDPFRTFVYLWRNLIPTLKAHAPDGWAPYWDVAPADTRMPDHTIAQHLQVTSLFSSTARANEGVYTNATFVLFTLGPVQSFIQQARKTKDLYWSSYLLSHLCWTAIQEVATEFGPDAVIFPDLRRQPHADHWIESELGLTAVDSQSDRRHIPTLPNRFFAAIEERDPDAVSAFMERVETAVEEELLSIGDSILENEMFDGVSAPPGLDRHLRQHLSTYWVGVPVQWDEQGATTGKVVSNVEDYFEEKRLRRTRELLEIAGGPHTQYEPNVGHVYSLLYRLTEKMLAAQKNVRDFPPAGSNGVGERGRKCSLCGERNALFHKGHPAQIQHNEATALDDVPAVYLADGEGLCGVGFLKRFAERAAPFQKPPFSNRSFPSTAEIASGHLADRYGAHLQKFDSALRSEVGGGAFDPQLYFDENLTPRYLSKYVFPEKDWEQDRGFLENKARRLRRLYSEHFRQPLGDDDVTLEQLRTSYYATFVLDGDDMSTWLAGEKAPPFEDIYHSDVWPELPDDLQQRLQQLGRRPMTPALHAALSRALRDYALETVRLVVDKYNGHLIYAGGDDVLAFINLHDLLDVLVELRAAFSGHLTNADQADFSQTPSGFLRRDGAVATTLGPDATASVGTCIAHYKTPLGEVIATARQMEERAKSFPGKNAYAIAALKRSGERTEMRLPFTDPDVSAPKGTMALLQQLLDGLRSREVSPTFIRTLRQEMTPLMDPETGAFGTEATPDDRNADLLETELKRLIQRATDEADPEWSTSMAAAGRQLFESADYNLRNVLDALDLIDFLNKETKRAHADRHSAA